MTCLVIKGKQDIFKYKKSRCEFAEDYRCGCLLHIDVSLERRNCVRPTIPFSQSGDLPSLVLLRKNHREKHFKRRFKMNRTLTRTEKSTFDDRPSRRGSPLSTQFRNSR